ncbi:enoyl-CoA hydratase-related protein [Peptoniphilus equinus]|uniref:Enoyl-CoA hydratase-related protein n=1 Tax=Peptoniphilus equinus TaxID=3016343 RepID=A0ABY7QU27_9FIRM|nr:enoyl-CoA hydratase-related protein [Peptoniphilus equinus]WBW50274.1 enoyl-CoA hydratase-related protein [Peptoniphilus equinus]
MDYKYLKFDLNDGILVLTIDRQKAMNALNSEVIEELNSALDDIEKNYEIEVVILTGAGKAFVAGADISEMAQMQVFEAQAFAKHGMDTFLKLEKLPRPVIAAVNGFALGGGCELMMSCDIRIASTKAKIGQPEVSLGITPGFGGTQRLARIVGLSKAKEMIFTGDAISADEAKEIGLVSYVTEPEALLDKAVEIAKAITKNSQVAVRNAKEAINAATEVDILTGMGIERAHFGLCFADEAQYEGMSAFLDKRRPEFNIKPKDKACLNAKEEENK